MCRVLSLLALLTSALPPANAADDLQALQGEWSLVAESLNGNPIQPPGDAYTIKVEGKRLTISNGKTVTARWAITLDPRKEPKWMDEKADGKSLVDIYRLQGDKLTIAFRNCENDPARPTDFEPRDGVGIYVLTRKKP